MTHREYWAITINELNPGVYHRNVEKMIIQCFKKGFVDRRQPSLALLWFLHITMEQKYFFIFTHAYKFITIF